MTTPKHQSTQESDWNMQGEPKDEQESIRLRRYLPWALEQRDKEHVSFASFVQKFKLSNLSDALETYETLINSTQLKTWRRQSLNTSYHTFKKHSLRRFWSNRMLKTERHETKTNFDIAAAKTARIVQNASLNETSRAAGLLEGGSNDQDELECSVRSKRKKQGGSFKENKKQAMAIDETSISREIDDDVATVSSPYETTASFDGVAGDAGPAAEPQPHFNLDSVRRITLMMGGFDVGAAFRRLQEEAAPFINDESLKVSIKKLYLMLSANSIWDTSERLPGMPADTYRSILSEIKPAVIRLSTEKTRLFLDLSYELAATGRVRSRALETEEEEDLLQLFQDLSKKLPAVALPSVVDNEDTYSHGALDSLVSFLFPASDPEYHLSWANRPSQGSRERRGVREANRPDCTIIKELFDMAFAEIKAPKDDHSMRLYIQDKWALTSLAKDTIDMHLRERRTITSIFCLQVFGYQLAVYELRFQSGLYMWITIGTGYLPRDKNDTHCLIRCMELLNTVRTHIDTIPVRQYVHTPPQRDPDHLLPEELRPQPTNITPSSRRFFGCIFKASTDTPR